MTRYKSDIELDEIEFDQGKLRSLLTEISVMQTKAAKLQAKIDLRLQAREARMRQLRELAEAVR